MLFKNLGGLKFAREGLVYVVYGIKWTHLCGKYGSNLQEVLRQYKGLRLIVLYRSDICAIRSVGFSMLGEDVHGDDLVRCVGEQPTPRILKSFPAPK